VNSDDAIYRVCSSYTPSLRALIEARRTPSSAATDHGLLIVADPEASGYAQLPHARAEASAILDIIGDAVASASEPALLTGRSATRAAVLARLPDVSVLHFSGHAIQRPDPEDSGLIMADAMLTMADIAALRLPAAAFAYLSACNSARTDRALPDVVTLAAAVHVCGYRNVIAVLAAVTDAIARRVGIEVYRRMITSDGQLNAARSAQALHSALLDLLDRYPDTYALIAPFVHIGP
jgi:CHAT domain-containing protein